MPLIHGKSEKAFKKNVETEMKAHPDNRAQNLAIAYSVQRRTKRKKMGDGGTMGSTSSSHMEKDKNGNYTEVPGPAPAPSGGPQVDPDKAKAIQDSFNSLWASGGMIENQDPVHPMDSLMDSIVDRIMARRSPDYSADARLSEGGQVANETEPYADSMPAEFDDLVLRDDLESSYGDDDNAGDSLGNDQEDEDRHDIVSRIMASRRKKDRMPRPA
jgi:hypothetical protein